MIYKKIVFAFPIVFSALLILFVIIKMDIEPYDQCLYQIVDESNPTIDLEIVNNYTREKKEEERDNYLKDKIKLIDFPQKGIVCEYVYVDEYTGGGANLSEYHYNKLHSSVYAVLYNDKTIRYIKGYISELPRYSSYKNFETSDGRIINYPNTFNSNMLFIRDKKEWQEESVLLSNSQYLYMIMKMKYLKLIDSGMKELPYEIEYVAGFYFNEKWHFLSPTISDSIDKTMRNLETYFRKCIGMKAI